MAREKRLRPAKELPPLQALRDRFSYDPEAGDLTYVHNIGSKIKAGQVAGSVHTDPDGYRAIRVVACGRSMKAHRIAWKLHHGIEPPAAIDHVDGDGTNNRIANLRAADLAQNAHNKGRRKDNTTGVPGVRFNDEAQKYTAQITARGARIFLGYFTTVEEAAAARAAAVTQHFGDFAASAREAYYGR